MRHRLSLTLLSLSLTALGTSACADGNGAMVQLQTAVKPDTVCNVTASNPTITAGFYDPAMSDQGYSLSIAARNNASLNTEDPFTLGAANIHRPTTDATISAWEACWFVDSDPNRSYSQYGQSVDKEPLVDCSTLKSQSATLPGTGSLAAGGLVQSVLGAQVLTPSHLKTLFGSAFNAQALPLVGVYTAGYLDKTATFLSLAVQEPANLSTRDPNWANFPTSRSATVVVQLRARWQMQGGLTGVSNWLSFPISVCPGCLSRSCGDLIQSNCAICPNDSGGCSGGKCISDGTTPCTTQTRFTGPLVAFGTAGAAACLPEDGFTAVSCTTNSLTCNNQP